MIISKRRFKKNNRIKNNFDKFKPSSTVPRFTVLINSNLPISSIRINIKKILDKAILKGLSNPSIKIVSTNEALIEDAYNYIRKFLKCNVNKVDIVLINKEELYKEVKGKKADITILLINKKEFEESKLIFLQLLKEVNNEIKLLTNKLLIAVESKDVDKLNSALEEVEMLRRFILRKKINKEVALMSERNDFIKAIVKAKSFLNQNQTINIFKIFN